MRLRSETRLEQRGVQSARVEKSLLSKAGAWFLTEREASVGSGANPREHEKLDLDERNASAAQNAAVMQI